jgi:hypothetical protein
MCAFPVVDDDELEQAGVEHLHHVLVFQRVGNDHQLDLELAFALEPLR